MQLLSAADVRSRIEPFLHDHVTANQSRVETVDAVRLLTWNRFDLAAKLLFLDDLKQGEPVNEDVYAEHIRLFTLGSFREPGNEQKNSLDRFKSEFILLYRDMQARGFNASLSLVPVGRDGAILNGAHRVACAIHLGLPVNCVRLDVPSETYDYRFFRQMGGSASFLDRCATRFVEACPDSYVALVWPSAGGRSEEIERIIPNIVYRKDVELNWNACHSLVCEIYRGEPWLGERSENYSGASDKALPCFSIKHPLRAYAFQAGSQAEVVEIKQKVRDLFNLDKHSIHINDTHQQAKEIAHLLFNDNSVHFLQFARPNRWTDTWTKLSSFIDFCRANGIDTEQVVLDSGMVLASYGLRQCNDIDYLCAERKEPALAAPEVNLHDDDLVHHGVSAAALVHDNRLHFRYSGIKFVAFHQVARMKRSRGEAKDKTDCAMMESLIEGRMFRALAAYAEQQLRFAWAKAFALGLKTLRVLRIYELVRFFYRRWCK